MAEDRADVGEEALWTEDSAESSSVDGVVWTGSEMSSKGGVGDITSYSALGSYGAPSYDSTGTSVGDVCTDEG